MPPVSSRTMIMSTPSTSVFLSGDESSRALYDRTGRRLAYTPSALRIPSRPLSGRLSGAILSNSGNPTNQALLQHGLVMEFARHFVQYFDCLAGDLGADSVTGENQYVKLHFLVLRS